MGPGCPIQRRLITNLDFPRIAREQFGIKGLEFVKQLREAPTSDYLCRLKRNMASTSTKAVLILCYGEGFMGHTERAQRMAAADKHRKWVARSSQQQPPGSMTS